MSVRLASASAVRPSAVAGLVFAVVSYAASLLVLAWSFAFIAGLWLPATVDRGPRLTWPLAAGLDLLLLALFAMQHSVMARPWFKRGWSRLVPPSAERASYVLASSLALALLMWLWRPLPHPVWQPGGPTAVVLRAGYCAGWLLAFSSTFVISHFDLFGLRQAWLRLRGTSYRPPQFTRRGLYAIVRHPLMTGFLIVFWVTPVMTAGHLLLAVAATGYILAGIKLEEHDLALELGAEYGEYRSEVPALVPVPRRRPFRRGSRR